MDSDKQPRYQDTSGQQHSSAKHDQANGVHSHDRANGKPSPPPVIESASPAEILALLRDGHVLMVNRRRRNGLILCKSYHAEFAGPGAAVGGFFDDDCQQVIPVGDLSLLYPDSPSERQDAYLIRRQWIRLVYQFTEKPDALQRAQAILNQFETYFDQDTINRVPDEAFALLVGVLPHTVRLARRPPGRANVVKVRS
ncbi:MAG TPA: hypothetical protein V6C88_01160 [Chroococcidiopsis sp.]